MQQPPIDDEEKAEREELIAHRVASLSQWLAPSNPQAFHDACCAFGYEPPAQPAFHSLPGALLQVDQTRADGVALMGELSDAKMKRMARKVEIQKEELDAKERKEKEGVEEESDKKAKREREDAMITQIDLDCHKALQLLLEMVSQQASKRASQQAGGGRPSVDVESLIQPFFPSTFVFSFSFSYRM